MRRYGLIALLSLMGCVSRNDVQCSGGVVCPSGTLCASVEALTFCVTQDQLHACKDIVDGGACDPDGTCHAGACIENRCGNALVDVGEVCDVAAIPEGERCSETCKSNETCGNGVTDVITNEECDDNNNLDHDGCSSACEIETIAWHLAGDPTATKQVKAAYDPVRGKVVVFDGTAGEVSEWDGIWRRFSVESPSPRGNFALAYDPGRSGVVLFGGTTDAIESGDAFLWNGVQWSQLPTAEPLEFPTMAYDIGAKQLVVFGARDSGTAETWVLGTDDVWTKIATASHPPVPGGIPRSAMAYDAKRGNIVYYDGNTKQTWIYAASSWTMQSPGVTPGVTRTALAYVPALERVVMFGGEEASGASARTYEWDGTNWFLMTPSNPGLARADHALAEDGRGHALAFGGTSSTSSSVPLADTWRFDGSAWTQLVRPPTRAAAAAAVDAGRHVLVRFGGGDDFSTPIGSETWELGREGWVAFPDGALADDSPPPLLFARMIYDTARGELVLFGGYQSDATFDDRTWIRRGTTWTVTHPVPSPPGRISHAMAYDAARGVTVLSGGIDALGNPFDDTWLWDGTAWTKDVSPGPGARKGSAMGYDPIAKQVVLFGGVKTMPSTELLGDVWIWDGAWHAVTTTIGTQPKPQQGASLTWDPAGQRLLLTGGLLAPFRTWAWRGSLQSAQWEAIVPLMTPAARQAEAVFTSLDGSGITAMGGASATALLDDWWELRSQGPRGSDQCERQLDADGDGKAGCDDPDCWPICAPLCPPATSCPTDAPTCGDGVCSPIESCNSCPSDCTTGCTAACGDLVCDAGETCPGDCP
jgi:cysteine-rich repeat protein